MGKPRRTRWVCPDCGKGALAPQRPRRNDVRRYCLPCSEATGRLVERYSPAQRKAAERAAERRERDAKRKREREWQQERRVWCRDGLDMREMLSLALRLPAVKDLNPQQRLFALSVFEMQGHASRDPYTAGGFVHYHEYGHKTQVRRIVVKAGRAAPREQFIGVLLHELAHAYCMMQGKPSKDSDTYFWAVCDDLHNQWNDKHADITRVSVARTGAYKGDGGRLHGRR